MEGRVPGPLQPTPPQLWENKEKKHKQARREGKGREGKPTSCEVHRDPVVNRSYICHCMFLDGLLTFTLTFLQLHLLRRWPLDEAVVGSRPP